MKDDLSPTYPCLCITFNNLQYLYLDITYSTYISYCAEQSYLNNIFSAVCFIVNVLCDNIIGANIHNEQTFRIAAPTKGGSWIS